MENLGIETTVATQDRRTAVYMCTHLLCDRMATYIVRQQEEVFAVNTMTTLLSGVGRKFRALAEQDCRELYKISAVRFV